MSGNRKFPRVLIAAPGSGSGKTLITCALLRILEKRGYAPSSFKCGPDYIDPMFHKTVLGIPSGNLDLFLSGEEGICKTLQKGSLNKDIGILEGVMGFYDGMGPMSMEGSSYDICRLTGTPAILVINCKGMGRSIIPFAKGFCEYTQDKPIKGIILNNLPEMMIKDVSGMISTEINIPILGFLPPIRDIPLESRHLGLVMPDEIPDLINVIDKVADILEKGFDLDLFFKIANEASGLPVDNGIPNENSGSDKSFHEKGTVVHNSGKPEKDIDIKIGIARDEAFCFYYDDNLELLKEMGAEPVFFSPLKDERIPDVSGIIIGGGYPELHAGSLSSNKRMLESIRHAAENGMPILSECGGFLYLQKEMETPEKKKFEMAGVFDGESYMTGKLSHFGYVNVTAAMDNPYLKEGEVIRGHEFHYYDTTCNGDVCRLTKPSGKREWMGYQCKGAAFGGFAHLYYPSCRRFIYRFMKLCKAY